MSRTAPPGASALLRELYNQTVPVPGMRRDERAVQCLKGMAPDEWMMLTVRDGSPSVVYLTELFVPADYRGRGFGTLGLQWFLSLVDKHGYEVRSHVNPFGRQGGLGKRALAAWYKRHGFAIRRDYSMTYRAR